MVDFGTVPTKPVPAFLTPGYNVRLFSITYARATRFLTSFQKLNVQQIQEKRVEREFCRPVFGGL
jgi:hypothetical protein